MTVHQAVLRKIRDCARGERAGTVILTADECGHVIAEIDANSVFTEWGSGVAKEAFRQRDTVQQAYAHAIDQFQALRDAFAQHVRLTRQEKP